MARTGSVDDIELLRETAELNPTVGVDEGLSPHVRFLSSSSRLVHKRSTRVESVDDPTLPAVFLLHPAKRDDPLLARFSRVPFLDQAATTLTGRVWLANETLNSGHFLEVEAADDALIETVVTDLGLGDRPAVVFDPRIDGGEVRFYSRGLGALDIVAVYLLSQAGAIALKQARDVIDVVHGNFLVTPQQQISGDSTWQRASEHWASNKAEAIVQSQLRVGLKMQFPLCTVEHERPVRAGRFDLAVAYCDPITNAWTYYGVLELKVLRSRGFSGGHYGDQDNSEAIRKGIGQAAAYRDDVHANWAFLCCFDMRIAEDLSELCFDGHRELATERDVELGRWRLYNSSDALRDAEY